MVGREQGGDGGLWYFVSGSTGQQIDEWTLEKGEDHKAIPEGLEPALSTQGSQ